MKNTITLVAGLLIVLGMFLSTNGQSQNRSNRPNILSPEMKRFDLNSDGQLSVDEKAIRVEVIALEAFSDAQFSEREIRQMYGVQADGFDRRGGRLGGWGGFRRSEGGSGRRLNPGEVKFRDGTATIPDCETFKELSYQCPCPDFHVSRITFHVVNSCTLAPLVFRNIIC